MADKWDYFWSLAGGDDEKGYVFAFYNNRKQHIGDVLNAAGNDGWELVGITPPLLHYAGGPYHTPHDNVFLLLFKRKRV